MVEHQVDRMVMVGVAVLVFGIVAFFMRDAMTKIMTTVRDKVVSMLSSGFDEANASLT
mgnify:CR=1 FL=1